MKQLCPLYLLFIFYIAISTFLSSCRYNREIVAANRFEKGYRYAYSNSVLNTSILFFGDYRFSSGKIRNNRHFRHSALLNKQTTKLFSARTNISPFINCTAFVIKKNSPKFYVENGFSNIANHVLRGISKSNELRVSEEYILIRADYDLYFNAWSDLENNKPDFQDILSLSETLREEMDAIVKTVSDARLQVLANPFDLAEKAFTSDRTGNYFLPVEILKKHQEAYFSDPEYKDLYLQTRATYHSFAGDQRDVQNDLAARIHSDSTKHKRLTEEFSYSSNIDSLVQIIGREKVTIINESHFLPEHRQFVSSLLSKLRQEGYKYLALESLGENAENLNKRGFPTLESGFYTREFHMSNLIRQALSHGYILVDYDTRKTKNRELIQARNIYKKTLQRDPESKVIVLAGHSHIHERAQGNKKWMAQYFHERSGINPFTINQEKYSSYKNAMETDFSDIIILKPKESVSHPNDIYLINRIKSVAHVSIKSTAYPTRIDLGFAETQASGSLQVKLYVANEFQSVNNPSPCFVKRGTENFLQIDISDGEYILIVEANKILKKKRLTISGGTVSYTDL